MQGQIHSPDELGFNFETVTIFKGQLLGSGSYGSVYKAKCDQLPCAAKVLFPILIPDQLQQVGQSPLHDHRQPHKRFEQECRLLSQIKHPNIVQYLGTYCDPDTKSPVLLMELMDESLTHFLSMAQRPLPILTQINLLHNTVSAIEYLHSNGIVHRDLSSNNVLIVAKTRAKVTDFGMSTLILTDAASASYNPSLTRTQCPGTACYMSPEALDEASNHTHQYPEKLDCFSFGVLIVQVATCEFPKPTDRFQIRELLDPNNPSQRISARVSIPEIERRQSHISLISSSHPLLPIALDCLKDKPAERPPAHELCKRFESVDFNACDDVSVKANDSLSCPREAHRSATQEKSESRQDQNDHAQTFVTEDDVQQLREQLRIHEDTLAQFKRDMTLKDAQIQQLESLVQNVEVNRRIRSTEKNFTWSAGQLAPCAMSAGSSACDGYTAYFNPGGSREVYMYRHDLKTVKWSKLPPCEYYDASLVVVKGVLTAIGGRDSYYSRTSKLLSLQFDRGTKWSKKFPAMKTSRSRASAVCSSNEIIVVGGCDESNDILTLEIMSLTTLQWCKKVAIPYGVRDASLSICGDNLYLAGGNEAHPKSVLRSSLKELLHVTQQKTSRSLFRAWHVEPASWDRVADLPLYGSTCITVQGELFAFGGIVSTRPNTIANATVYKYDSLRYEWVEISRMGVARLQCLVAVLSDNKVVVVGGKKCNQRSNLLSDVETAELL